VEIKAAKKTLSQSQKFQKMSMTRARSFLNSTRLTNLPKNLYFSEKAGSAPSKTVRVLFNQSELIKLLTSPQLTVRT
jgi:hypothetical protein